MLPTRTSPTKRTDITRQKEQKDDITFMFGAGISGEYKLPLLVFGQPEEAGC